MKHLLHLICVALAMFIATPGALAQNKALEKALEKEYKTKLKQLNKEKWELASSSRSLEVVLLKHYEALSNESNREIVGEVSSCGSLNICRQAALNNACTYYAALAGSSLKGRVVSDMSSGQTTAEDADAAEFDRLYSAYERLVEKEIKGEIKESFSLKRVDKKTGRIEYVTYFIVNEDAATQARIRAWENAARESEAAQKYGFDVSDFVKDGFDIE